MKTWNSIYNLNILAKFDKNQLNQETCANTRVMALDLLKINQISQSKPQVTTLMKWSSVQATPFTMTISKLTWKHTTDVCTKQYPTVLCNISWWRHKFDSTFEENQMIQSALIEFNTVGSLQYKYNRGLTFNYVNLTKLLNILLPKHLS